MNPLEQTCDIFNELIRRTVKVGGINNNLQVLRLDFRYNAFVLNYVLLDEYTNGAVLLESILSTTDNLLNWVDLLAMNQRLSIVVFFNRSKRELVFQNYYDLMQDLFSYYYESGISNFRGYLNKHPRIEEYTKYLESKRQKIQQREYERKIFEQVMEWELKINSPVGIIPETTSFLGKIKNKIVDLLYV